MSDHTTGEPEPTSSYETWLSDSDAPKEPLLKQFWRWLTTGQWRRSATAFGYVLQEQSRFGRLRGAWSAIMRRRSVHPVPVLYLVVLVIGTIVGVVLQLTLGVPWFIAPLVFFVLAWGYFFSSIWWGPQSHHETLREAVITQLSPERGRIIRRQRVTQLFRDSTLRWFTAADDGLDYELLSFQSSADMVDSMTLRCAAPEDLRGEGRAAPLVVGVNHRLQEDAESSQPRDELRDLFASLEIDVDDEVTDESTHEAFRRGYERRMRFIDEIDWQPLTFEVEGELIEGYGTEGPRFTLGYCALPHQWIIAVHTLPPHPGRDSGVASAAFRLREISDRETFIAETVTRGEW